MQIRSAAVLLLTLLAPTSTNPIPASAVWGFTGHKVVGAVADALISDHTQDAISEILGEHDTLSSIATWADEIRDESIGQGKAPLHYVNVERNSEKVDRALKNGENVLGAIATYSAIMKDPTKSLQEHRNALAFVVHFVGDVHQPLHVSYAEDKGGNKVRVKFFGRKMSRERRARVG
jgi:S1/P1 Nuclease